MNDMYVECLVKQKQSALAVLGKYVLIALCVISVLLMLIGFSIAFFAALLFGAGAYFITLFTDLEFEYLYVDKEITVDKIMAKSKRKNVGKYGLDRIEIIAPIHSYQLDNYKNRNVTVKDYSIGEELKPDRRYAMYYEGGIKVIFSPSEEMIKVLKNVAPRKVFSE